MEAFVTLEEFIDNKGILEKGRDVFCQHSEDKFYLTGRIKSYDKTQNIYLMEDNLRSCPASLMDTFIKIEVVPIWK